MPEPQVAPGSGPTRLLGPWDFDFAEQHTVNHVDCPACVAADEALQARRENLADMTFPDAAAWWMRLRRQNPSLRARAHEATQGYLNALEKFLGALRLFQITPGHLRGYQIARVRNAVRTSAGIVHPWKRAGGHSTVNHEISVLGQMLRHCGLWHAIRPYYFPLHINGWSPRRILSEADEARFFAIAARHPEASLAYWIALITNNTTASGSELRGLRLQNLFLLAGDAISEIYIPEEACKNTTRPRKIPLNGTARWAVSECYKRALRCGSHEPDHYLFPFREQRDKWDPARPASRFFLRKSWDKLRELTGYTALRPHDLRHHCITRLLENGVEPETVTAIAGHRPNSKMLEYYAHHRTRVKYAAVQRIEGRG